MRCNAFSDDGAGRVSLCFILTGLRRSELVGLRWGHVNLVEQTLRGVESKSEEGERLIALPRSLAAELERHYAVQLQGRHRLRVRRPDEGLEARWRVVPARVRESTRGGRDRGLRTDPRPAPRGVDEPGGQRSLTDRRDGNGGTSFDANTKQYLHLAGTTFAADAAALEVRLLAVEISTRLS